MDGALHATADPVNRVVRTHAKYRYYVLGVLTLTGVCSWVDRQLFSILLESIKQEFRFTDTQLGLLGGIAFGLFYAAVGLPLAWVAERFSRRNLIACSLGFWSGLTALCGFATGFPSLFLARMGVGIGEAGGSAPAQSMISDYFSARERGAAMGIQYTSLPIGYVVTYGLGGWADSTLGWRTSFVVFGIPGILLALIAMMTVREPRRGASDSAIDPGLTPSLFSAAAYLFKVPALRHICLAGAIHGLGAFGAAVWVPAYFMRTHDLSSTEIGTNLAIVMGSAGLAGALLGGWLSDRLAIATANLRWYLWLPGLLLFLSTPFAILAFSSMDVNAALWFYSVPILCNQILLGPIVATLHNLAGLRRRAMIAAFYLFLSNLVSMGFGPLIIGFFSDFYHAQYGTDALRYSILTLVSVTCVWGAAHLYLASRTLIADLRHAS